MAAAKRVTPANHVHQLRLLLMAAQRWFLMVKAGFVVCALMLSAAPASAEPVPGEWIRVPSPIDDAVFTSVKNQTQRALSQKPPARKIVYHFLAGDLSNFGPCADLADFLIKENQGRAETYAYVDKPLRGHAVLPALACQFLYMGPDAMIGFDEDAYKRSAPFDISTVSKYLKVSEGRGKKPTSLILKMLDQQLVVYQVKANGKQYKLDKNQAGKYNIDPLWFLTAQDHNSQPEMYLPQGSYGYYTTDQAVETGVCGRRVDSAQRLVETLGLPASVVNSNPLFNVEVPRALWVEVRGEINRGMVEAIKRKIDRAVERENANCIILQIDATGGPEVAGPADNLAKTIQDLNKRVLTVAYVPTRAAGAALYLVFSCQQIVMGPKADLDGSPLVFRDSAKLFPESEIKPLRERLVGLAEEQGYPPVLIQGLLDMDLEIVRGREKPDPNQPVENQPRFMSKAEFEKLNRNGLLEVLPEKPIKEKGRLLRLDTDHAWPWGIARHKIDNPADISVLALYGIKSENTSRLKADWLDDLISVLTHPVFAVILIIVGFIGVILEFKAPGTTVPAVVAAICFVLFFWSQSRLSGEALSLAILLFLLGLVLIGVEIFVLPGFGVTGIAGILLVLLGLALAVMQQWPQTQTEYFALGKNIAVFAGGLIVSIASAYALARYLPQIPYANKLVLTPPGEAVEDSDTDATLAQPAELLGAIGVAVTTLRPAGKARFADQFIDVVAEGYYVEAGSRVQVIEIDGMRVVVKPV